MRARAFSLLAVIAFVSAAVVGIVDTGFCRFTLHVPKRDPGPLPPGYQNVEIATRDDAHLEAWFVPSNPSSGHPTTRRCVMILHGIGDTRNGAAGFAPLFLNAGYSVLMPDSRAHGRSGGELVTYGLLEKYDVLAWAAWAKSQGCVKLYGLGESLGAAVLIQAAPLTRDFAAIVAESAYCDLRSIANYRIHQTTQLPNWLGDPLVLQTSILYARLRYGLDLGTVSPLNSIGHTQTPILLIHGLNDSRTPYWHSQALAAADPKAQLWLVPGADHTAAASTAPEEFRKRVLGWFAEN